MDKIKIAIVGAGLGGLTSAVALHKKGFNVEVYEKAQDFRPVGGGLGLLPNGSKILDKIYPGIVEEIKNLSCHVKETVLKNTQGENILTRRSNRFEDNYGYPLITVWWWRLQQTLASKLPTNMIHLNHRCTGFSQDNEGVDIYFDNQEESKKTIRADLLIGADGIKSVVRRNLIADGEPRFLNSMSWRAVIKSDQELISPEQMSFVRGHREFMYLLNVGNGEIAWLYRRKSEDYSLSANKDEAKSRVLEQIAEWGKPLRSLVEETPSERILEGGICDRLPIDYWSKGRVVLLGDAAHPMAPAAGQGANSSFEDAWVIAESLSNASSISEALTNYEQRRIPRLKIIQTRSARGEMRYYETESEKLEREQQEPDEMSAEEFGQFVHNSPI
ncbi:monooxygenase FAD-binding protein [Calothrix parasitica NIES-267]|uniref:Monooxygenase FAD-binding protein n=1 Tax=Calothrix parasitica NIES-267 TaxID=1973488 RepID=A0A1Z4LHM5_9CYAN|nr:monooxygenase FAD-binding protein [Calothrix parasitica NIES-267]